MAHKNSEIYPIGTRVYKFSGNPFKSGFKVATVTGVVTNEHDPKKRPAYTFEEDDSIVNCELCGNIEEHVPNTFIDIRVGDIIHMLTDKNDIDTYLEATITYIEPYNKYDQEHISFVVESDELYLGRLELRCVKAELNSGIYIGKTPEYYMMATTKNKLLAAFINECTKAITDTEDEISHLEDKISNLYRGIRAARDMKRSNQ